MEEREYGSNITLETRKESYDMLDKNNRYNQILTIMKIFDIPMTAKEIAVAMKQNGFSYSDDRNVSAPRINEMLANGKLDVVGKIKCQYSGKKVSCFTKRKEI